MGAGIGEMTCSHRTAAPLEEEKEEDDDDSLEGYPPAKRLRMWWDDDSDDDEEDEAPVRLREQRQEPIGSGADESSKDDDEGSDALAIMTEPIAWSGLLRVFATRAAALVSIFASGAGSYHVDLNKDPGGNLRGRSKICSVLVTSKSNPLGGQVALPICGILGFLPSPFSHFYLLVSRMNFVFLCIDQDYCT
ncbi:hypothetical protein QYE76_058202 [Lolium multiflorum]|uniref:Uncharacterized protein n=1 Tax=Lolium multiflorum TaxID=4521 RepID=A0AAD8WRD6_LOLMU|nr:hypothetical protein QYE76_058202 [Lolium multiflorum]